MTGLRKQMYVLICNVNYGAVILTVLSRQPRRMKQLQSQQSFPKQSAGRSKLSSTASCGKMRPYRGSQIHMTFTEIWCSETQNQNFFLSSRTEVPLKSEFRPAMKVLSRKPAAADAALGQLSLDGDDRDEDEDDAKERTLTAEERQLKAQQEREEKQKKYEEARQRLFGASNASMDQSPGNVTPPRQRGNGESRGLSKSRGIRDGRQLASSANGAGSARQLYDPSDNAKSDAAYAQRKDRTPTGSGRSTPNEQQQPIRSPRGPDGSGRGGFGFGPRGGKVA